MSRAHSPRTRNLTLTAAKLAETLTAELLQQRGAGGRRRARITQSETDLQIADYPAADSHHNGLPVGFHFDELIVEL